MRLPLSAAAVAAALVLALTGCAGTPTPTPSGSSSSSVSPTPGTSSTPTPEEEDEEAVTAAVVVVTASTLSVFGTDGSTLVSTDYEADAAAVGAALTAALGEDPVVSETDASGGGCDSDLVTYDFGGLVIQSPGSIGSTGAYEAQLFGPSTRGGVPIETVAGQRIGAPFADFSAAVGDEVILADYGSGTVNVGYDQINPGADEYEEEGAFAFFTSGVLTEIYLPHRYWSDC